MVDDSTWTPSEIEIGQPFWDEIVLAMSWARFFSASERRLMPSARSSGVQRGKGPLSNASRAAATARSTSAGVASGTRPITSSVLGEMTSMRPFASDSTNLPPTKI